MSLNAQSGAKVDNIQTTGNYLMFFKKQNINFCPSTN